MAWNLSVPRERSIRALDRISMVHTIFLARLLDLGLDPGALPTAALPK